MATRKNISLTGFQLMVLVDFGAGTPTIELILIQMGGLQL